MFDILFAALIVLSIFFALKYLKNTRHCNHKCNECKHPCHTRY